MSSAGFIMSYVPPSRSFNFCALALLYLNKNVSRRVVEIPVILEKLNVFGR